MTMAVLSCLSFPSADAYAACTNPAGTAGEVIYNTDANVPQYCDGTNWNSMFKALSGSGCSGPSDCMNIGDQCTDTTIFAGCNPVSYARMYLHPNNQSAGTQYSTVTVDNTSVENDSDGEANQTWIVANTTITQYPAFKLCKDLNDVSALGYNDWYLPSRAELFYFWVHSAAINAGPGDDFTAFGYWSSTQVNNTNGWYQDLGTGAQPGTSKSNSHDVRCMRK
ncbi:MAG: DUF1566 domain-containing protein [Micavibrio aeruginosavorus]|nr:DUF1566 domain-containing protein [Micavibrio aeruginosavorus]